MTGSAKRVLVTGAAGQIGYAICPMVAAGRALGPNQPVILHLLDIEPARQALEAIKMELDDCAYPLLQGVVITTSLDEAAKDVDVCIAVGGMPRKQGMERKDLIAANAPIFVPLGKALNDHAAKDVRVLVVANPANTNALLLSQSAPRIPKSHVTALTRLDHNRAMAQLANRTGTHVTDVKNLTIWGNHSATQYPDVNHGTIRGQPIRSVVKDDAYLNGEFITTVQQRGAKVIEARKASSAFSAANAACDHVRDWVVGTSGDAWVSMGVITEKSVYGVPAELCYSYPVHCKNGEWSIVQGLTIDDFSRNLMDLTARELQEEREAALQILGGGSKL